MGIITTNANIITGSATRTLGTLGRSIFNSTIGMYPDKEVMNQIYGAIDNLTSSIETINSTHIDRKNRGDDLFLLLAQMDIKDSSDFMNKNREFMKRLMRINIQEREKTLDSLGVNISGYSDVFQNEDIKDYHHTYGNNYMEQYVKTLPQNQLAGDETTTLQFESGTNFNYAGIHNDLYVVSQNLYPDDEDRGTFGNKWLVENKNSLLYKTKKLFSQKKVSTIISRFHTDPTRRPSLLDNARTKYGLSHGRNLLTKESEDGLNSNYANGYDNPYCRVWTHHHQYDRYYKTIRPFSHVDSQGEYQNTISVSDFHAWKQFSDKYDTKPNEDGTGGTAGLWGWKKESNNGWQYSVLQDNGKVNITPKYVEGGSSNIHTKQCMFSIENLAWRGYDPYSFEQALSWEQRGPLGGRIMWFPPYGIQFNETTTTQWQNNTFLGRGEDVYTYTNTTRSGTLSFMMVVDHPSILDYVSWTSDNKDVTDTDILRFLAGCGEGDGRGLRERAKPTPLTDEYVQVHDEVELEAKKQPEITAEEIVEEKPARVGFCFYVFYPNNYSGTYDDPYSGSNGSKFTTIKSNVEAIPYLLGGKGANKGTESSIEGDFADDKPIDKTISPIGDGYEMNGNGLGNGGGCIFGTSRYPNENGRKWKGLGTKGHPRTQKYATGTRTIQNSKKWYYRIDGRYSFPKNSEEENVNYYNQTLLHPNNYVDDQSFGLNLKISKVKEAFDQGIIIDEKDENNYILSESPTCSVFTLAEMAKVLWENEKITNKITGLEEKRLNKLKELLERDIESITANGFASSHGYVDMNIELAKNRAMTAAHWFVNEKGLSITPKYGTVDKDNVRGKVAGDHKVGKRTEAAENGEDKIDAKKWRSAYVIIKFKAEGKINASETEPTKTENDTVDNSSNQKVSLQYNPTGEKGMYKGRECEIYKDDNGKKWFKTGDNNFVSVDYVAEEFKEPISRFGKENKDENRLRYDQEYHFFKVLKQTDPLVFNSLMDKLQYFDPAFHSMTPEGFNGRLTFLQQCMRQGNTVSASDGKYSKSANNLAFGRAPYCVLRLGDFYNQMIIIDNMSISYDPLVWDLNVEGVGVQPLIANVQLSFKFIGGGDLTGPVRRLQNAMSFNYYANARLYDNRADRVERRWSDKTAGAIENDEIIESDIYDTGEESKKTYNMKDKEGKTRTSYFYNTKMYK